MQITRPSLILLLSLAIMLSGCVETLFLGAVSSAVEFAKDRSPTETVQDVKLATTIKAAFAQKNFSNLYVNIKPEVMRGRVLLTGEIEDQKHAVEAINLIWQQEGVIEVINELKINKESNKFDLKQYTKDSLITSQIKSKIFFRKNISFVNYTIITLKNIVYLFGIAASEKELEEVALIAANISGVQQVISHVKLSDKADNNSADRNIIYKKTDNGLQKEFYEDNDELIFDDID